MIDVANLTECKELYQCSGWNKQYWWWQYHIFDDDSTGYILTGEHDASPMKSAHPAYDSGYLLRMLPPVTLRKDGNGSYVAEWVDHLEHRSIQRDSRTNAENAMCRLAIALYEAGVMVHQEG